jgi:hypothetical protein
MQKLGVLGTIGVPAAVPGAVDAEAQTDRIDFLTHQAASSTFANNDRQVRERLLDPADPAAGTRRKRFMTRPCPHSLGNHKLVDVEIVVVFRIGDGRLERLLDVAGDAAAREGQVGQRGPTFLPRMIAATSFSLRG